jgi:hypothetical protein
MIGKKTGTNEKTNRPIIQLTFSLRSPSRPLDIFSQQQKKWRERTTRYTKTGKKMNNNMDRKSRHISCTEKPVPHMPFIIYSVI